jgi:hypothetical protein
VADHIVENELSCFIPSQTRQMFAQAAMSQRLSYLAEKNWIVRYVQPKSRLYSEGGLLVLLPYPFFIHIPVGCRTIFCYLDSFHCALYNLTCYCYPIGSVSRYAMPAFPPLPLYTSNTLCIRCDTIIFCMIDFGTI